MTAEETLKAAAIQWDIRRGDVEANRDAAIELLERAVADGVELAVLPEMWATSFAGDEAQSYRDAVADAERRLTELTGDLGLLVVGSNYEFGVDGTVYNRASVIDSGRILGTYRKVHLFTPQGEDRYFGTGDSTLVVETRHGRIGVATCYDLRFPELIRQIYLEGAELFVCCAQWPEPREHHWRILVRARAIENQWFVIATNRCGVEPSLVNGQDIVFPGNSLIVDPTGAVLAHGNGEAGTVTADLELKSTAIVRRAIPVGKDRQPEVYERLRAKSRSLTDD